MDGVTIVFVVLAAVVVFAIAAAVVGREAHRLDAVAPRVVYTLDEAVDYVCDRLPPASQARLTPAEVELLLTLHLRWLRAKGLMPVDVVDHRQDIAMPTVFADVSWTAYLLGEAERPGPTPSTLLDDVTWSPSSRLTSLLRRHRRRRPVAHDPAVPP